MKIIGIASVKQEREILPYTVAHMFRQGVDELLITHPPGDDSLADVSVDNVLAGYCAEPFDQAFEMTRLAHMAKARLADWIVPFDADEFWCAVDDVSLRDVLADATDYDAYYAPMYLHVTPEERAQCPKPLPKVCFRPAETMEVAWGQHTVSGTLNPCGGRLIVRELQYRSWDHFLAKIARARELHTQPHMEGSPHGWHMQQLLSLSEPELREEWWKHVNQPTVVDPIPGWGT